MAEERNYETLKKDMEHLRADLSEVTKTLENIVSDAGRRAATQASQTAARAKTQAQETVVDHPLASLAGAFGIGVLLGSILNRRS